VDAVAGTAAVAAEAYLSVSSAERAWHRELGTDPYTSNDVLQNAVSSVAWADRLGRFGIKQVGIPKIPGVDIIDDVNDAVWSKDPYELRDYNQGILQAAGADEDLIEQFFDNRAMSPTLQTLLIAALAHMETTTGRELVIRGTFILETETEARFYVESAMMLAWYHSNEDPITRIDEGTSIPVGIRPDGSTISMFAADRLYWNETVADNAAHYLSARDSDDPVTHDVWLSGSASDRVHREAGARGWDIHENLSIMTTTDAQESLNEQ